MPEDAPMMTAVRIDCLFMPTRNGVEAVVTAAVRS
jgi:hypothetical protein